jgi:ABC-type amino acid transport substrate-binding protein
VRPYVTARDISRVWRRWTGLKTSRSRTTGAIGATLARGVLISTDEAIMRRARRQRIHSGAAAIGLAMATVAMAAVTLFAQTAPLRLVSTAWSPFTNAPGQPRVALDLVDAALRRIGVNATTTLVDPPAFTSALLTGPYDGSGAVWKDADRERVLLFSRPYLENRLILVGRRGADVSAATFGALAGKRVALVDGYSYGDIDATGPTFVRTKSDEDGLTQLLHEQVDYALVDDLVIQHLLSNYPGEAQARLQIGTRPLIVRPLYLAIRRSRPDAESIVSRFDDQLVRMIADRTYHQILHVDWLRADVDGDGVDEYVPKSDRAGKTAPQHAYTLVTSTPSLERTGSGTRFYLGGNIYTDWASVPNRYKVEDPQYPDPRRSTASVFTLTW